ncbi:MAG: DUF6607 family protein [Pseudomonadota bacterium]
MPRRIRHLSVAFIIAVGCWVTAAVLAAVQKDAAPSAATPARQYTFAWQFLTQDAMAPRGGTTRGSAVELVTEPTEAWKHLHENGISTLEQDRRAILAMAGGYRTSFDFIETVGFVEGYTPQQPYQSWGTEYVYVVADEPRFISLQHIIVMRFQAEDGSISEPMVVKHWRQDWHYEARDMHRYAGHQVWEHHRQSRRDAKGRWRQAVYQVDDSPRYMASGTWEHFANYSSWTSEETWRPLPRREFSVRDDYHVLIGTNRHTIYPTGWVQEESNLKVVLDEKGEREAAIARENGLARYERIANFDWQAGDEYWSKTGPFWALVRDAWEQRFERESVLEIAKTYEQMSMFMAMFQLADSSTDGTFDPEKTLQEIDSTLNLYISSE